MVTMTKTEVFGDRTEAYGADPSDATKTYEFRYKVVELGDLIASHTDTLEPTPDYPRELQPRLRDRAASRVQIDRMAANLNPRVLLHDSGFLDTGPMIVGKDNVVESGNGRVLSLRKAAQEKSRKYAAYVEMLTGNASRYGLKAEDIGRMERPVLVRERITPVDRVAFAAEANVGAAMGMSPFEQSLQDAGRLSDNIVKTLEVGEDQSIDQALRARANSHIVSHFVSTVPANERATIADARGDVNQAGLQRLRLAIFAKTYEGEAGQRLVRTFSESVDPIIKNVEQAMFQSLPDMAKAESLIATGVREENLSLAQDLADVIDRFAVLKQTGMSTEHYLAQGAMFGGELNPMQRQMLSHLDSISRSPKKIRLFLRGVADKIIDAPPKGQVAMPGLSYVGLSKEEVVNAIINRQRAEAELPAIPVAATTSKGAELGESDRGRTAELSRVGGEVGDRVAPPAGIGVIGGQLGQKPLSVTQEPGQPEAGLQVDMWGKTKEVRPEGKGQVTQIAMGEYVKLEEMRKAAKPTPATRVDEAAKEPWQMTKKEYVHPPYTSPAMHKYGVRKALAEGKAVPREVLADYPDLLAEAPKAPPTLAEVKASKRPAKPKAEGKAPMSVRVQDIQGDRSPRATAADRARLAKRVLPMRMAELWMKHPNRYDIRGVDTPKRRNGRKPRRAVAGVAGMRS